MTNTTPTADTLVATSNPDAASTLRIGKALAHAQRQHAADSAKLAAAQKAAKAEVFLRYYQRLLDCSQSELVALSEQYERRLGLIRAVDPALAHIDEHVWYLPSSALEESR